MTHAPETGAINPLYSGICLKLVRARVCGVIQIRDRIRLVPDSGAD